MTLKQVFIINKDLKMRAGKVAVQVAHGETIYMSEISSIKSLAVIHELEDKEGQMLVDFIKWTKDKLMKKIVLKAIQERMLLLIGVLETMNEITGRKIWFDIVFDKGLTQVPTDSMTCIVVEPLDEQIADIRFDYLKLL